MMLIFFLSLSASGQEYRFPTSEEDYGEYYPTAYVDHGGNTDWNCGSITYGGHDGSDFGGGSWTGMDEGRDIVAAAIGTVSDTHDGEDDTCSTGNCPGGGGYGNYVKILHPDGYTTLYAHMATWSIPVSIGDAVSCGEKIGEMGSSGYSTGPHLHFEVRDTGGTRVDPFYGACSDGPSLWVDQGEYDDLPGLICADIEPCAPVAQLTCGETIHSSNDAPGSSQVHGAYGCAEFVYSGPEISWSFSTDRDEPVRIDLGGHAADLDLFVLTSEACDGTGCLGWSTNGETEAEWVEFDATAEEVYTVVIDGWEGATSDFELSADCEGVWPGSQTDTGGTVATGTGGSTGTNTGGGSGGSGSGSSTSGGTDGGSGGSPPEEGRGEVRSAEEEGCGCAVADPRAGLLTSCLLLLGLTRRRATPDRPSRRAAPGRRSARGSR